MARTANYVVTETTYVTIEPSIQPPGGEDSEEAAAALFYGIVIVCCVGFGAWLILG